MISANTSLCAEPLFAGDVGLVQDCDEEATPMSCVCALGMRTFRRSLAMKACLAPCRGPSQPSCQNRLTSSRLVIRRQPSAHLATTRCKPSMLGMSSSPSWSFSVAQSISTDCRSSSASSEELPKPQAPSIPATVAISPSGSLMARTSACEAAATAQRSISLSRTAQLPLDVSAGACGLAAPVVDATPAPSSVADAPRTIRAAGELG